MPGIKVDAGTRPLALCADEVVTEGLDRLRDRFEEYAALGARFAKWPAVIRIGDGRPTTTCIEANAHALARYAALSQEAGLTPIVEPEVLMDGHHSLLECATVTETTLRCVYDQLARHRVVLEATLLKPNMVPGTACEARATDDEIAEATLSTQPWELSFSFGRALKAPVLRAWAGEEANRGDAQAALLRRAGLNSAARTGSWLPEMEE